MALIIYFAQYVLVVPGNAGKSRPRKTWRDVVEDDLKNGRLDRSLAKDRDRWRAQIIGKTSDLRPTCASTKKGM